MRVLQVFFMLVCSVLISTTVCQRNGDVRLMMDNFGRNYSSSGRVEIYLNSVWGTVQVTNTSSALNGVGQAVCRQLGYNTFNRAGTVKQLGYPAVNSTTPRLLSDVVCVYDSFLGNAPTHILQCDYFVLSIPNNPNHTLDFAVECSTALITDSPYDTQVRLIQGGTNFTSSGFVEVYMNNRWGPVCNMDKEAADTACRQLGYTEASTYNDYSGLITADDDQIDLFTCNSLLTYACLRGCYTYSYSDLARCSNIHSVVNCTFTTTNTNVYGSQSLCTYRSLVGLAIGVTVAVLVVLAMCVTACACIICCCIPGCILHGFGRRGKVVYETI